MTWKKKKLTDTIPILLFGLMSQVVAAICVVQPAGSGCKNAQTQIIHTCFNWNMFAGCFWGLCAQWNRLITYFFISHQVPHIKGVHSSCVTGSCSPYHWPPLTENSSRVFFPFGLFCLALRPLGGVAPRLDYRRIVAFRAIKWKIWPSKAPGEQ